MANCSGHQVKADQREVLSEKESNFGKTATFSGDGEGGLLGVDKHQLHRGEVAD